jgi:hypothetical protein
MFGKWSGHRLSFGKDTAEMKYTMQRIEELLGEVDRLKKLLDGNDARENPFNHERVGEAYYALAIAKAKLMAMKTEKEGGANNETV